MLWRIQNACEPKLSVLIIWQRLALASGAPESFSANLMQKHQLFNPGTLESRDRLPTFFFIIPFFLFIQNWNVGGLARWPSRICIHMQIRSCSAPPVIYSTCTVITRLVRCVRACLGLGRQLGVYRWIEGMQITGVGLADVAGITSAEGKWTSGGGEAGDEAKRDEIRSLIKTTTTLKQCKAAECD